MEQQNLVIGANSFIGHHLISSLKNNTQVVGVYNSNKNLLFSDIINLPIENLDNIDNTFKNVYILSSCIKVDSLSVSNRRMMYNTNIELVEKICSKFEKSKIIFCSSVMVYESQPTVITEKTCTAGLNEYGITKIWGEKIVKQCKKYAIVRPSFVYGREMKLTPMICSFVRQAVNNNVIKIFGKGERKQNFIHVSDVVNFLRSSTLFNENDTFLATNDESFTNLQIAEIIAKKTNSNIILCDEDANPSFTYDNTSTIRKLKYTPEVSLDQGIDDLIKWIIEKKY